MGTGPPQCLVSSGGWPWGGGVHSTHSPPMVLPSLARESQHACPLFHPLSAVQHRDHFSTFSLWHKQDVPLASKCPWRNYTLGLIVYISSTLDESEIYSEIVFIMMLARMSHYCHRYCLCFAFLFIHLFILLVLLCFFFSSLHTRSIADPPPGSFNSTITQRSTISARASAGRIRVTWAAPDCNQSENNECRTKAGAITLAGLTFLSLSVFFFSLLALFLSPSPPSESRETNSRMGGGQRMEKKKRLVAKE